MKWPSIVPGKEFPVGKKVSGETSQEKFWKGVGGFPCIIWKPTQTKKNSSGSKEWNRNLKQTEIILYKRGDYPLHNKNKLVHGNDASTLNLN